MDQSPLQVATTIQRGIGYMNEYRVTATRVTNYVAFIEAEDEQEAELLALNGNTDWQFLDDDDYEIYEVEEAD